MDDLNGILSPQLQGILSGAFSGMQASGPSRMPTSLGQVIGAGGQAGLGGYNSALAGARQYSQQQSLIDLQKQETAMKAQQLKQLQDQYEIGVRVLKSRMPGLFGAGAAPAGALSVASGAPSSGAMPGALSAPTLGQPPSQLASGGDLAHMSPDDALALQFVGGSIGKVGEAALGLRKLTAQRPGAAVINELGEEVAPPIPIMTPGMSFDTKTRTASPVPGYATGAAGIAGTVAGATESAKAPYEMVQMPQQGGGSMPVPKTMVPGFGQPPTTGTIAGPIAGVSGPPVAINQLPPNEQGAARTATTIAAAGGKVSIPGTDPWATMPRIPQPSGIGPQSTYREGLQKESAAITGEMAKKFGGQADAANTRLALNDQALSLVDSASTGPFAARIADVKGLLVSRFGIPEDDFTNTPSATVALQKDLVNAATQKAKAQFGSRITQSEVMLMLSKASPNVDMPKAAIKYLLQTDNATSQYQIKQSQDFAKYINQGGDPMQFEAWYANSFPMSNAVGNVHLNTKTGPAPTDADIAHTALKYKMSVGEVKKRLGIQ